MKLTKDCTSIYSKKKYTKEVYVVEEPGEILPPIQSTGVDNCMSIFIKWSSLNCGDGSHGPIVLIMQWPNLPEDAYVWIEMAGITSGHDSAAKGVICVCKGRCANQAAWKKIYLSSILPFIKDHQEALGYDESNLSQDGEACIMNMLMEPDMIEAFSAQDCTCLKLGAARSLVEQSADANKKGFRSLKSALRKIFKEGTNTQNINLENRIIKALQTQVTATPGCEDAKQELSYIKKNAEAIVTLIFAMRNCDAMDPKFCQETWIRIGQHALRKHEKEYLPPLYNVLGFEDPSVSIPILLRLATKKDLTDEENDQIIASFPEACAIYKTEATLTRSEMDALGIPRLGDDEPPREDLVLWRQSGLPIHAKKAIERYNVGFEKRRPRTEEEKEIENQAAIVAKDRKDAAKNIAILDGRAETKRRKEEEKAVEKERKNQLSKEEKKQEANEKKENRERDKKLRDDVAEAKEIGWRAKVA